MINVYVNYNDKKTNFKTIAEAINYISEGYTPPAPQFPAEDEDLEPATIHVAPGVYRERIALERPYVTLSSENAENTVIVYNCCALDKMSDGGKRGTFRTATARISTHDVTVSNLTFKNDAGHRHKAAQALALYADGDRLVFRKCRFIGYTDTLFAAPSKANMSGTPQFESKYPPNIMGRQYYEDCYIEGDLDFIFGGGIF